MKISVIGAGGFVGSEVVRQLQARADVAEVRCVDLVPMNFDSESKLRIIQGDFSVADTLSEAVDGVDSVIFLAAILGGAAEANYDLAKKVNIDATLSLIEHLRDTHPSTRFVLASTIAVYAKPMPDLVNDLTTFGPTMVYGAQKLMMEVAVSNFAAKGWLDGVSVRPSGVMARDGADAALKSAFMSRLFWCVKRSEDIELPVGPDSSTWLTSVQTVADNFIHAATLESLGSNRAFTLPALRLTFGELVAALKRAFPDSISNITFNPDPELVSLFGSYPQLDTAIADQLGFKRDKDADALIAAAMLEE